MPRSARRPWVLGTLSSRALLLAFWILVATSTALAQSADDPCSARGAYIGRLRLEAGLTQIQKLYPWVRGRMINCTAFANLASLDHKAAEQSCLNAACDRGAACATEIPAVLDAVKASARARDLFYQQQHGCKAADPNPGPLDAYFQLSAALWDGDVAMVRKRVSGTEDEIAQDLKGAQVAGAFTEFYRTATLTAGAESSELTRLIMNRTSSHDPEEYQHFHADMKGSNTAMIRNLPGATFAAMILENGQWRRDASEEPAEDPINMTMLELNAFGLRRGAKALQQMPLLSPLLAISGVYQCFIDAQFVVRVSLENAEDVCARVLDAKVGFSVDAEAHAPAVGGKAPADTQKASPPRSAGGAAPGKQDISALVDQVFLRWTRSWGVDQYVPGSAQAGDPSCNADTCQADGSFQFTRFGSALTATFETAVGKQDDGQWAATKLCYSDPSSGTRDCAR